MSDGRVEALLEVSQEALYALSPEGIVERWTWGCETLFGIPRAAAIGLPFAQLLVRPEALTEHAAALRECRETGSAVFDAVRWRPDGGQLRVQGVYKWVAPAGQTPFVAASERDLTDGYRLQQELSRQVWSLTEAQEFLRSILESSRDYGIIALDLQLIVQAWNSGAHSDFGIPAAEAVGQDAVALMVANAEGRAALRASFAATVAVGTHEGEFGLTRRDGKVFKARLTISARRDSYGDPVGFVVIIKDLTEEKRAEAERHVALERLLEIRRLKEINEIRTQLLNTASHELGTPLTPIKLNLHVLGSIPPGVLEPVAVRALASLARNFDRLQEVVAAILEVARVHAGTLAIHRTRIGLDLLVAEEIQVAGKRLAAEGLVLRSELGQCNVEGDPVLLGKVVHHLLDNAGKFTPRGGKLAVATRRAGEEAIFEVTDECGGLTAQQHAKLFFPFSQAHDTMQQTRAGVGIGLFLCKGILEQHGGRIWVEDAPGGCRFSMALPVTNATTDTE